MGEARRRNAKNHPRLIKRYGIAPKDFDRQSDITVEGKSHQTVMIAANAAGRKVVDDLWPEVGWSRDAKFASRHAPDWQFTHVRVTRLQYHIGDATHVALEQATPDGLGFVIAQALQRRAAPRRVFHFTGEDEDLKINIYDNDPNISDEGLAIEYVPAGVGILKPVRERN